MSDALIFFGFIIAASLFTALSVLTLWRAYSSRRWPRTTGQVIVSKVERAGFAISLFYVLKIRYEYDIAGKIYKSDRYSFDPAVSIYHKKIEQIVSKYPTGRRIFVYYNPTYPAISVIENGTSINNYLKIFVGCALWLQVFKLFLEEITK
jgi:hypothetical protein